MLVETEEKDKLRGKCWDDALRLSGAVRRAATCVVRVSGDVRLARRKKGKY